jgi:hypothetical protein
LTVSLSEYADGLVRIAMGRLFWSFERAMKADCMAIAIGFEGNNELLRDIFGSSEPPEVKKEPELPPLTPADLRSMFRN